MSSLLRPSTLALQNALAAGTVKYMAELITIELADGVTVLAWTNFGADLISDGVLFTSQGQFLSQASWKVTNSMEVPTCTLKASSLNVGFNGGAALQLQIHNGLFDGALVLVQQAYMGTDLNPDTLGAVPMFFGEVGGIDLDGLTATLTIKGKNNDLDQYVPHNLYQIGCNHAFCDPGCTLSRATYTANYTAGTGPSSIFLPWASVPSNPGKYQNGWLVMNSGVASGSRRSIAEATSSGLGLTYPLAEVPSAGDTFSATQGCDKTLDSGSVQSCTAYSNTQHFRGFPFVPPPASAY